MANEILIPPTKQIPSTPKYLSLDQLGSVTIFQIGIIYYNINHKLWIPFILTHNFTKNIQSLYI